MVTKIISGEKYQGARYYNGKKMAEGKAELLFAFGLPSDELSFAEKWGCFRLLIDQIDQHRKGEQPVTGPGLEISVPDASRSPYYNIC